MKRIIVFLLFVSLAGLVIWGVVESRKDAALEAERESPIESPAKIENGVITLNQETFTKAGMTTLQLPKSGGIQIPLSAVIWYDEKAWVYVRKENYNFSRQPVTIISKTLDNFYEISGLQEGSTIVAVGAQLLLSTELGNDIQQGDED
ncbi:MAG: hypothetical protein KGI37_06465 [Alphaproteobacteria bacterium]|nr:hypothetical protein [Alphaproteobacteria bacterium]